MWICAGHPYKPQFKTCTKTHTHTHKTCIWNKMTYSCRVNSRLCSTVYTIYTCRCLKWLIPGTKNVNMNKFKKDPELSCIKICGLFQCFDHTQVGQFLRLYFLFEVWVKYSGWYQEMQKWAFKVKVTRPSAPTFGLKVPVDRGWSICANCPVSQSIMLLADIC